MADEIFSINPATEEVLARFRGAKLADVGRALASSARAFAEWKDVAVKDRARRIKRFGQRLLRNKRGLARLITIEMGKPIRESEAEIEKCAWLADYFSGAAPRWLADEVVKTDAQKSYVRFEPVGVVAAIMPWNFPFWQPLRFAIPALLAGNAVVLKHSSAVPQCALKLEEMFNGVLPKGVFRTLLGRAPIGEALVRSNVNAVSVTGSVDTGRRVAALAADGVKKIVLELGGSDPFIVLEDADLKRVCGVAAKARMLNCGQSCTAAKRFIAVRRVAKEFTEGFVEAVRTLRVGDPLERSTDVGPLVRPEQLQRLEAQVRDAVRKGAKVLCGGRRLPRRGYFYEPTVLLNVKKGMKVLSEETFGPVAPIVVVEDEGEAVKAANDSDYGLGASVWTANRARGERIAQRLEAGVVFVNGWPRSDPRLPFGGIKRSGYGRELGRYGLLEFCNIKSVKVY